jgi:hypothetical protein
MSKTVAPSRLSRDLKNTGESAVTGIAAPMIEFLSGPEYLGVLQHHVLTLPRVRLTRRSDKQGEGCIDGSSFSSNPAATGPDRSHVQPAIWNLLAQAPPTDLETLKRIQGLDPIGNPEHAKSADDPGPVDD